ncbi:alpha-1,3-mannosyltransferase [Ferrimonas sediminum]|uniref:Alpha-1,3-mannosyltransferase n=1 Tax=Ferrimonas sediminum TaxID=718193 RepID=A0A1G9AMK8_9GAMM|nr:glycosyltransferase family 4 protein [Ferrimonas sediminum]SDK28527.1 alpha-1,3-mannosyltransferase [Ferrimonas sediminum]
MHQPTLKVAHIVRQFHPGVGGLEKFVMSLVQAQRQAGVNARVISLNRLFHQHHTPSLPQNEIINGIEVKRIGYQGSYKYPIAPGVLFAIKDADIVHVHGIDFFFDYLSATRWFHHKPMVVSTHGGFFHTQFAARLKRLYFRTISRWAMRGYGRVLAISNGDFSTFRKICDPERLLLVENGVDIDKFANAAAPRLTRNLLFIGRFSDNKRLDRLLDTFAQLCQHHDGYHLDIAGRDWDHNLSRLRRQISALGLQQSVKIHIGLSDQAMIELIQHNSFITSASEYEGFGQTLVEGMAAGLIPIASDIDSFKRVVDKAGLGLTVDFSRSDGALRIHQYIEQCLAKPTSPRQKAIQAAQQFSFTQCSNTIIRVYLDLINRHDMPLNNKMLN